MYRTTGPGFFKATGPFWLVALALLGNLVLFAWFVYFTYRIAVHVGAWPFG